MRIAVVILAIATTTTTTTTTSVITDTTILQCAICSGVEVLLRRCGTRDPGTCRPQACFVRFLASHIVSYLASHFKKTYGSFLLVVVTNPRNSVGCSLCTGMP